MNCDAQRAQADIENNSGCFEKCGHTQAETQVKQT